ncbi:hypothetical protein FHG87_004453 [Trinorchestia longiramus]|nr:hypothetical protein FHG87_004453 [Trinorchestia longiramus]
MVYILVTRPPRRSSIEGRDDKPPPYEDIEKMDAQPPDYPSAVGGCTSGSESPPSYHWLARMYQWGNLIDTTASGSHCNQPSTSCDPDNAETLAATEPSSAATNSATSSPLCRKTSSVLGEINHSFQNNLCDPCDIHISRKMSSISNPSTPSKLAPVLDKFKRDKSNTSNGEDSTPEDPKKSGLWTIRRHFLRSMSDEGFMSLPSDANIPAGCSSDTTYSLHYCVTNETGHELESNPAAIVNENLASSSLSSARDNSEVASNNNMSSSNVDLNQISSEDKYRTVDFTSVNLEPNESLSRFNFNSLSPSALLATYNPHKNETNNSENTRVQSHRVNRDRYKRRKSEADPSSSDTDRMCSRLGRRTSLAEVQSTSSRLGETYTLADELVQTHRPSNAFT